MSGAAIRETFTALGVVVSLVFVGLELRQNTLAVKAAALNDFTTGSRDYFLAVAADRDLVAATLGWRADEELDPVDATRVQMTLMALLRNLENVFLQVRVGAVDEGALQSYGFRGGYGSRNFRQWWAMTRSAFNPEFVAAFEAENGLAL
jgi:hypothetical protein